MPLPWILCGLLAGAALALWGKLWRLQKSMDEICTELAERLSQDTNTLISVSSGDRHVKGLAAELNKQLRLLRKQRQRYASGDRELKEAVTNISHDLRTPLTAIRGYLDLLEREDKSENIARYLSLIQNRVEAMKQLTEELFRYSMVTSPGEMKPERVDLGRALEESLLAFYGAMQCRGITPELHLAERPVWRTLDRTALNRIFSNIIGNAIKYSDGDFEVRMEESGAILFSNTARDLTPVTAGRLFDRFYTVEASRGSTGLGLSIAKHLTERMGGCIAADFRDQRLCITVRFPAG